MILIGLLKVIYKELCGMNEVSTKACAIGGVRYVKIIPYCDFHVIRETAALTEIAEDNSENSIRIELLRIMRNENPY